MSAHWKNIEREVCRIFGGERSGPVGKEGPDCRCTGDFAIQVKHRTGVPKWLTDAMTQAIRDAPQGTLPTLVLHRKGDAIGEAMVIFRLGDFRAWYL